MGRAATRSSAQGPDRSGPGAGTSVTVVPLTDPRASDVGVVGGKAASLHRAARDGLPVLPGVVVPVGAPVDGLGGTSPLVAEIHARLGPGPLVVRSSSPWEDAERRSMAGRFVSIPGVVGQAGLAEAVRTVARSGERVSAEDGMSVVPPVAVLVQPMVTGKGGVCFGVEPVSGRADRVLAVVAAGGPGEIVAGRVSGVRYLMDPEGHIVRHDGAPAEGSLTRRECRELAALVARVGELFGRPQDVEFLFDDDGALHLLQSRPVTTEVRGPPVGPVYGSGPVAETFPDPLRRLEESLWVDPLRDGLREALRLSAAAGARELRERPLVVVVDGRVAIDLELADGGRPMRWWEPRLRERGRRAWATWRVGRLKGALPALGRDVVQHTDALLADVGSLAELSDRQLVGMLDRCRALLRSLHAHEILMGLVVSGDGGRLTGVSVAMRSLAAGRRDGLSDEDIVARTPVVLALTGPRIGEVRLPRHVQDEPPPLPPDAVDDEASVLREALRLRVRWVQELTARAVGVLATRLAGRGRLPEPASVVELDFEQLAEQVAGTASAVHPDVVVAAPSARRDVLPARFRLDAEGRPVGVDAGSGDGTGAGGGRGIGPVVHEPDEAVQGSVLVVAHLTPDLAWVLPRLAGLVAETGSPLAHLAILAREAGVPTVVASPGATARFDVGTVVTVDGATGRVAPAADPGEER